MIPMKTAFLGGLTALCLATPAFSQMILFGSDNDGYGGFTSGISSSLGSPLPTWSEELNGVRFTNAPTNDSGQVNSSLLRQFTLDRTDGRSFTITGVADWTSTYAGSDNNRLGIALFATSDDLAGAETGLSLHVNLSASQIRITPGVNGTAISSAALSGVTNTQLIGQTLTYVAAISFVGSNIEIDFTLSAPVNSYSQTISTTVAAASYTGDNFGFSSRGRVRNTSVGVNDSPFIYEAQSFTVVPEPTTMGLVFGALGVGLMVRRRFFSA